MTEAGIPVLLYHAVNDQRAEEDRFTVSRKDFAAHADAVRASGREPLLVSELAAALRGERQLPERPVAITFDDGYADTYDALQLLLGVGLGGTVYVTTGQTGAPGRLSARQLAELAPLSSVELGAHGVQHRRLDELRESEVSEDLRATKARLEDLAGLRVDSFAYPHGAHDARVREAVIAAGYTSAAAVKNAMSHADDDPFAIARWTVTRSTPASRIAEVLEGTGVERAWAGERLRTHAYRTARRGRRRLARALGRAQ